MLVPTNGMPMIHDAMVTSPASVTGNIHELVDLVEAPARAMLRFLSALVADLANRARCRSTALNCPQR